MKIPFFLISILSLFSCEIFNSNQLEEEVQDVELTYIAWACDCANWATLEDAEKYAENIEDSLAHKSIFIEPASKSIELPDTLGYANDVIKFTGSFYENIGYPKNYYSFQTPPKARVFRYIEYEVIESNYKPKLEN